MARESKLFALRSSATRNAKESGLKKGEYDIVEVDAPDKKSKKLVTQFKWVEKQLTDSERAELDAEIAKEDAAEKAKLENVEKAKASMAPQMKKDEPKVEDAPVKKLVVVDKTEEPTIECQEFVGEKKDMICGEKFHSEDELHDHVLKVHTPPKLDILPDGKVVRSATSGTGVQQPGTLKKPTKSSVGVTQLPNWAANKDTAHKSGIESPTKMVWHIADEMKEANPNVSRKAVLEECVKRGIAFWTARTQYQQWLTAQRESAATLEKNGNGKKK